VRHVACAIYLGSGGGFSWRFGLPDYQVGVTAAYIASASVAFSSTWPPSASYNDTGRGYPDVASLAQFGIPLCTYGGCSGSGGTSASAPTVAGMLSLVNDARLDGALPPLGFINPRLCAARPVARCVVYVVWRGACCITLSGALHVALHDRALHVALRCLARCMSHCMIVCWPFGAFRLSSPASGTTPRTRLSLRARRHRTFSVGMSSGRGT